jgi:hypothetical protein
MANVTNQGIVDMLRVLGYGDDVLGSTPFNVTGNMHGEFKNRVASTGVSDADFARAEKLAGMGQPKNAGDIGTFLQTMGIPQPQIDDMVRSAGIDPRSPSSRVDPSLMSKLYQSIGNTLGDPVRRFLSTDTAPSDGKAAPATPALPPVAPVAPPQGPITPAPLTPAQTAKQSAGGGDMGKAKPETPADVQYMIEKQFGYTGSLMQIPEVGQLINQLASEHASDGDALARFESTDWFRKTNDAAKAWQMLPPGEQNARLDKKISDIRTSALKVGLTLSDDRIKQMANDTLQQGWDDNQLNGALGAEYHYVTGQTAVTGVTAGLKKTQGDWMVPMGDDALTQWGQNIISGKATTDQFTDYARNTAAGMYGGFAQAIKADPSNTVKLLTEPYRQQIGATLEVDPNTINFLDSKWNKVISNADPKTGQPQVMDLSQATQYARSQPEWAQTRNANQTMANYGEQVLKSFGKIA